MDIKRIRLIHPFSLKQWLQDIKNKTSSGMVFRVSLAILNADNSILAETDLLDRLPVYEKYIHIQLYIYFL